MFENKTVKELILLIKNREIKLIFMSESWEREDLHLKDIIELDNFKIIERGSHKELISKNGHYKKLSDLQSFS